MNEQSFIFLEFVRQTVISLPEVTERLCHDMPAFYAGKCIFCRLREDGETLAVYTKEKDSWMAKDPVVYFTTDHYRGYDYVLVKLPAADPEELKALLLESWQQRATKRALRAYAAWAHSR